MPVSSFGYDSDVGQQPGPGGWWPGTNRGGSGAASGIDYGPTGPGSSGEITQISDLINQINRGAQTKANEARIPMAPTLEAQSSRNIQGELQGQLPPDVLALIGQQAAEAGVASGSVGSPAAYLKALGLTSLQQEETGQRDLSAAYARNPAAPIYDASGQLITPYQAAQLRLQAARLDQGGAPGGTISTPRGGSPGYGAYSPPVGIDYSGTTTGATYIPPANPTATWLQSIGYITQPGTNTLTYPGPTAQPGTGSASYVDPTTNQMIDYSTGHPIAADQGGPVLPGMATNLNPTPSFSADIDWNNLFAAQPPT